MYDYYYHYYYYFPTLSRLFFLKLKTCHLNGPFPSSVPSFCNPSPSSPHYLSHYYLRRYFRFRFSTLFPFNPPLPPNPHPLSPPCIENCFPLGISPPMKSKTLRRQSLSSRFVMNCSQDPKRKPPSVYHHPQSLNTPSHPPP